MIRSGSLRPAAGRRSSPAPVSSAVPVPSPALLPLFGWGLLLACGALAAATGPAVAQAGGGSGGGAADAAAVDTAAVDTAGAASSGPGARSPGSRGWRFPVGERAVYEVRVSLGSVPSPRPLGEARLSVEGTERIDGTRTYRTSLEVEGGIPMVYRMDDRQVSWIAPDPIRSLRYLERLREGDYRRHRRYRLDQARGAYTRYDRADGAWRRVEEETEVAMPANALDEVSFLYFVRSLPLEPGDTYRYERFFEADGNPVEIEVLGREEVRVPAGRFETVVVRPVLQTDGLFAEGGRARVWLSDDERRIIVKIESSMKVGRVDMYLRSYEPGDSGGG